MCDAVAAFDSNTGVDHFFLARRLSGQWIRYYFTLLLVVFYPTDLLGYREPDCMSVCHLTGPSEYRTYLLTYS